MLCVHFPNTERAVLESYSGDRRPQAPRPTPGRADGGRGGLRPAEIVQTLQVSTRTVPRRLNPYLERGLDGLRPGKAKGAHAEGAGVPG
ncbi:MAG: hypothetical protein U0840_13710 [Gemmataceae bacterium]